MGRMESPPIPPAWSPWRRDRGSRSRPQPGRLRSGARTPTPAPRPCPPLPRAAACRPASGVVEVGSENRITMRPMLVDCLVNGSSAAARHGRAGQAGSRWRWSGDMRKDRASRGGSGLPRAIRRAPGVPAQRREQPLRGDLPPPADRGRARRPGARRLARLRLLCRGHHPSGGGRPEPRAGPVGGRQQDPARCRRDRPGQRGLSGRGGQGARADRSAERGRGGARAGREPGRGDRRGGGRGPARAGLGGGSDQRAGRRAGASRAGAGGRAGGGAGRPGRGDGAPRRAGRGDRRDRDPDHRPRRAGDASPAAERDDREPRARDRRREPGAPGRGGRDRPPPGHARRRDRGTHGGRGPGGRAGHRPDRCSRRAPAAGRGPVPPPRRPRPALRPRSSNCAPR